MCLLFRIQEVKHQKRKKELTSPLRIATRAGQKKIGRRKLDEKYNLALKEGIMLWTKTKETRFKKSRDPSYVGYDQTIKKILEVVNDKHLKGMTKSIKNQFY